MADIIPDVNGTSRLGTRITDRANATTALSTDPKFKKYTQQVDKCLASFENVHEWADFIAFLTKLLKTLQSFMQFKEIPRKLIVGKRLAQCLNPALPTGVHQRALDVYSHVLAVLGPEGLKRDLQIWSAGLFPFFAYSATSVRPTLLNIYDTHYLALKSGLRPVMKAFILALLPGLEEENGEFFDKVLGILDRLSATVSQAFFLQNVWLVLLTTPSVRCTAVAYLSRRFPKLSDEPDITAIVGRDVGLMVRAFASSLEDDDTLVRRGVLELLNQSFKMDSPAFKKVHREDQEILVRAALGVVLRRDLSLSRRLYTWLLGNDETSDAQIAYLKAHGLDLVRKTLQADMSVSSDTTPDPRPYKIFISLLDKWEIGSPLTEVLIIDAMRAIQEQASDTIIEGEGDLLLVATTLYEVIEPISLWRPLFSLVVGELIDGGEPKTIRMIRFILRIFRTHDQETLHVHLPLFLTGLMELINALLDREGTQEGHIVAVRDATALMQDILGQLSSGTLNRSVNLDEWDVTTTHTSAFQRAASFYALPAQTDLLSLPATRATLLPFLTTVEDSLSASAKYAHMLVDGTGKPHVELLRGCFSGTLSIIVNLVSQLDSKIGVEMRVEWKPLEWLSSVLSTLDQQATFEIIDKVVSSVLPLSQSRYVRPPLPIDNRETMARMVSVLLQYLRPSFVPYHVRVVQLIWAVQKSSKHPHVEALVSQSLIDPIAKYNGEAYDAFGVLWRLTDDSLVPGFHLKVPLMIVLDTLKSEDMNQRRIGETWMRCYLKSYLRVLDPILHDVMDPSIRRTPAVQVYQGREARGFTYDKPIDLRRLNHILESLLSVKSPITELVSRAEAAKVSHESASYMDVLIEVLLRFIQSEPKQSLVASMLPGNAQLQATALDLLQAIVSQGEVDPLTLDNVEAAIISKLYVSVHAGRLELQNKLLHVLHSVILASSTATEITPAQKARLYRTSDIGTYGEDPVGRDPVSTSPTNPVKVNPLFVQTLVDGISKETNRPILQHWIDFILMTIPQFQQSFSPLIFPLCDCICRELRTALDDVVHIYHDPQATPDVHSSTTDAEFIILLNALERLVLLGLAKLDTPPLDDENVVQEKPTQESSGLLGLVSNVFGAEVSSINEEYLTPRSPGYQCLDEAVRILYSIWIATSLQPTKQGTPILESLQLTYSRVRLRCRKVLERLFRAQSAEVLESLIECWSRYDDFIESSTKAIHTFEVVDMLTTSAQTLIHMLCESISYRYTPASERTRKLAINPNLSDAVIYNFMDEYLGRLEGPIAVQVWNRYLSLAKEVASNVHGYKRQVFPTLKCLTTLAEKVAQTTAIDEKRIRKELQDTFVKLADTCVLIAGRSFEQGNWIRRGVKDGPTLGERSTTPLPRVHSEVTLGEKEKVDSPLMQVDDTQKSMWGPDLVDQINDYLARSLIPNMRRFLVDGDKIAALCTNVVYYVVNPSMKSKSRVLDVDNVMLDILTEMSKIPAAIKAWRSPVSESFNDTRFFNGSPSANTKWKPLIRAMMDSDKQLVTELVGKITIAASANIFANREYEMLLRSLNLRRLSYVLFVGERNQCLAQLPQIQEKLVDILRATSVAPVVISEVYLCLRVLLCRLSPHNMNSFWPVILTEMFRVFEQCMASPPSDGADDLTVILAACKFLDLVLVLQTEEFQVHQWMFVTDTVDAVYRPESWMPESIMDQLAEIIADLPDVRGHAASANVPVVEAHHIAVLDKTSMGMSNTNGASSPLHPHLRRPLLSSVRSIESIKDLVPFFSHVSLFSYESVYSSAVSSISGGSSSTPGAGSVDWEAVERTLLEEIFEGR